MTISADPAPSCACLAFPAAVCLALLACGEPAAPPGPAPPKVPVAHPVAREVQEWDEFTGRFAAPDAVEVRARVSGYLTEIRFRDGQLVRRGDVLFVVDPRPYAAAVAAAEAEVATAQATLDLARLDFTRADQLAREQFAARQTYDQRAADVRRGEARLAAARAALDRARLDLDFTQVRAPVNGRADRKLVSIGNLVSGGDTGATLLTTIVSIDPIHVYFDIDQNAFLRYTRAMIEGTRPTSRDAPNPVRLALADERGFPHQGRMDFVSNQIDQATGTLRGRALFENRQELFLPGQFARVQLIGSGRYMATMIPDAAIGSDQSQRFVFVVRDGKAMPQPIEIGPLIDGLRVVRSGITPADTIVIGALQRVRRGQPIEAEPRAIEAAQAEAARP